MIASEQIKLSYSTYCCDVHVCDAIGGMVFQGCTSLFVCSHASVHAGEKNEVKQDIKI